MGLNGILKNLFPFRFMIYANVIELNTIKNIINPKMMINLFLPSRFGISVTVFRCSYEMTTLSFT